MRKIAVIFIGFVFMMTGSLCWAKDDYPIKPIEVINAYAPGGPTDFVGRMVGDKMAEYLGQPLVLISKPGGATAVGSSFVAKSKPDGYTLLITGCGIVTRPLFEPSMPYRINEFIPIGIYQRNYHVLAANNSLPVKNLAELVDYAKKNPKTLSYGISGVGAITHLAMELFKLNAQLTDTHLQCIPYPGDNPALLAVIGNHVQVSLTTLPPAIPHINAKAVRALAIPSEKRNPLLPEVPTTGEQGFPNVVSPCYHILLAPAKTPEYIVKKLEGAMEKALQDKGVQEKLEKLGFPADFLNSKDTQALQDNDGKKWSEVIKKANLSVKK